MAERAARRTFAEVREAARAERDIEVAAFLDGYAMLVRSQRRDNCAGPLATAIEGLASSLRAGLVDDGLPPPDPAQSEALQAAEATR